MHRISPSVRGGGERLKWYREEGGGLNTGGGN